MRPDKLSDAIGLVDEPLVAEAEHARCTVRRDRRWWAQWIAIAACLCLMVASVFSLPRVSQPSFSGESVSSQPKTDRTNKCPVVSKAMVVSQAVYPDRSNSMMHWDTSEEFREGNFAQGMYDFYEPIIKQILVGEDGKNRVFSPLNVYMALATLAETTDGVGQQQILNLLGAGDIVSLREKAKILWEVNYNETTNNASLLANSLWLSNKLKYNKNALDVLAETYYASAFSGEMGDAEYNRQLQEWINTQTNGILEDQASSAQMNSSLLNLVSTVYFGAKWIDEFDPERTREGVLHAAGGDMTCDFMRGDESLRSVSHGEGYMAMNYALGVGYDMVLVLPDEGVCVNEVIRKESLYSVLAEVSHPSVETALWQVTLTMPKFDVEQDVDLVSGLRAFGVTDVFDGEKADFSRCCMMRTVYPSHLFNTQPA